MKNLLRITAVCSLFALSACMMPQEAKQPEAALAGGNCCLKQGSQGAHANCNTNGDKCCMPFTRAGCASWGGFWKSSPSACTTAPATC